MVRFTAGFISRLAVIDGGEILRHVASGLKPLPPLKFTDEAVHALTVLRRLNQRRLRVGNTRDLTNQLGPNCIHEIMGLSDWHDERARPADDAILVVVI